MQKWKCVILGAIKTHVSRCIRDIRYIESIIYSTTRGDREHYTNVDIFTYISHARCRY